jgi:hypothetical protein
MRIRALCIDDSNRPNEIPLAKWPVKGKWYHIIHIYMMVFQEMVQGCELSEFDISGCAPYNCYRLSRFAIHEDDIGKLIELIKACADMNGMKGFDVQKYVDDLETHKNDV